MRKTLELSIWPIGLLSLALGCAESPVAPDAISGASTRPTSDVGLEFSPADAAATDPLSGTGWASFFPLQVGNRWSYEQVTQGWFTPTGGTPEPLFVEPVINLREREITGTIVIGDQTYAVLHQVTTGEGFVTHWDYYYRQSKEGFFETFADSTEPGRVGVEGAESRATPVASSYPVRREWAALGLQPAVDRHLAQISDVRSLARGATSRARGAALEFFEATWLSYALHPKKTWLIVDTGIGAPLHATVVRRARLELEGEDRSGYQIQLSTPFLGPLDEYFVWYGRDGFLGESIHVFFDAFDETGAPIGTIEIVANERLTDLSLQESLAGELP